MICKIAIAQEGFIDIKDNYNINNATNFEQMFIQLFEVEDKDLLGFDGISCTLEVLKDPTNSVFIYKNDTGNFLYQIQSATPLIHKNKMLWTCAVALLEDLDLLNEITQQQAVHYFIEKGLSNNALNESKKDNFKPIISQVTNINYNTGTLKLKFMVNPLNDNRVTTEADGSFVFVYPLQNTAGGTFGFNSQLYVNSSLTLRLSDIISKYSTMLKSIEYLPFTLNSDSVGNSFTITEQSGGGEKILAITTSNAGMATTAGIWLSDSNPLQQRPLKIWQDIVGNPFANVSENIFFNSTVLGGAFKIFLRTPLANIPLTPNLSLYSTANDLSAGMHNFAVQPIFARCNCDGWQIDGMFRQTIPAHYLNFYTDSSGNIFIQNMTTNAYELKELEANYELESGLARSRQQDNIADLIGSSISGLATDPVGSLTNLITGGATSARNFEREQYERDRRYQRAVGSLNRKIETETLLAKFTGKQIAGQVTLNDFLSGFNGNYFAVVFETNTHVVKLAGNNFYFDAQKDYDYSCLCSKNNTDTFVNACQDIFSLGEHEQYRYSKGLNYNCVFKFSYFDSTQDKGKTSLFISLFVRNPQQVQTANT